MLGAIFGDLAGSVYEADNIKTKDFNLYADNLMLTDDTIMTVAVTHAILDCLRDYSNLSERVILRMRQYGKQYPYRGYGYHFNLWLNGRMKDYYNSCGNGSAMRVSAVGWLAESIEECKDLSYKVTAVTHNHPEGLKGAEAIAVCIFLARQKWTKEQIKAYVQENYYPLTDTVDQIRAEKDYFDAICQQTVPQALICFFESTDFEDCIRNAISIGGDSDTLAAIAGSVAEAFYGMNKKQKDFVNIQLPTNFKEILDNFDKLANNQIITDIKIEEKEEFNVALKVYTVPEGEGNSLIPNYWDDYLENYDNKIPGMLGVCLSKEVSGVEGESFGYGIGNKKEDCDALPEGFKVFTIPCGLWGEFYTKGKMPDAIQMLWAEVLKKWLPASDYKLVPGFDMECYTEGDTLSDDYISSIRIRLEKK